MPAILPPQAAIVQPVREPRTYAVIRGFREVRLYPGDVVMTSYARVGVIDGGYVVDLPDGTMEFVRASDRPGVDFAGRAAAVSAVREAETAAVEGRIR